MFWEGVMSDLSAIKLNGTTYTLSDDYARDSMAKIEYGTLATKAYAVGDFLINNNHLYKVTSAIAIGVKFVVGTNIELVKLSDEVKLKAPLASPTFTGTPKVPTASTGTKTTQIASTAYVQNEIDIVNNNVQSTIDYVQNELGGVLTSLRGDLTSLDSEVDTISDDVDSLDSAVNILTRQGTTLRDDGIVVCNAVDGGDNVFFMIDNTLTEAYKAADAKATGDAISSLNEEITNLSSGGDLVNGWFTPAIAGTGNIDRNDGSVATNGSYSYSDYVDISGYDKLTTRATQGSAFNAFYASDKTFISAFSVTAGNDLTIVIPANAVYMRVSNSTAKYNDTFKFKYLTKDNADKINDLKNSISVLADQTVFIPLIEGLGYISVSDGAVTESTSYSYSDYIDISDYDKLYIDAAYASSFNAFYASDKTFISAFSVAVGSGTITIPENAVYMRVSNSNAKFKDTFVFKPIGHANAVRISAVEDAISGIESKNTDYFVPKIASTGYISNNDGSEQTNANYSRSDYVDISNYGKLITNAAYDSAFCAFYNSSKQFASAFIVRAGADKAITIPDNAVYMRVSGTTAKYEDTFKFRPLDYVSAVRIGELDDAIDTLADSIAHSGDTFSPPSVGNGNVSRDDGSIVSGSYLHSDYIDISQFPKLLTIAQYDGAFNAFYDADKNFIAAFDIRAGEDQMIIPPFGAAYMRVSGSSSKYADTMHFRTLEYVTSDALPDYWFGHMTSKVNTLRDRMGSIGKNGETFVFATDVHWYRNQQHSPKLIKYLLDNLNINMVVLGGDLITQGAKDDEVVESLRCIKAFRYPDVFVPTVFGNHDNNSNQDNAAYRFDMKLVYSLFMKGFEDSVTWLTDTETSFYFDKPVNKTRYIFLDMGDDGVSRAFTAFAEFRDALLSTPAGYKIVIVAHIIDYGTFTTSLTQMIDAYNSRTSVTVNSVACDFTSASGSVVICLGGHRHFDDETASAGGVPITVTDCDAMLSTKNSQTAGTVTEQALDVVSLDYANSIAYYERIGRGKSRIVHLTPVSASNTLTTTLSGTITWSSGDDTKATVSNGTITRVASGAVAIRADNGTTYEVWICNS